MNKIITPMLTKLRLGGMNESLEVRLHEASSTGLTNLEFFELMLQDEINIREDRQIARRIKRANFRDVRKLEDFDFSFNPSIKKSQVFELATGRFVRERRDVLWLGPPGTGKSHLAQAIGLSLIRAGMTVYYRSIFDVVRDFLHDEALDGHERILKRYLEVDLLIIDDMGMKQLPKRSGEYLFEVIMRLHDVRSTMITSNRPLEEWGQVDRRRSQRDGDPGPVPAPQRRDANHRPKLPNGKSAEKFKQYQSANGSGDRRNLSQTVPPSRSAARPHQLVPFEAPMSGTV